MTVRICTVTGMIANQNSSGNAYGQGNDCRRPCGMWAITHGTAFADMGGWSDVCKWPDCNRTPVYTYCIYACIHRHFLDFFTASTGAYSALRFGMSDASGAIS
eukprot:9002262-Pyramimonas_sp.AAC.1